MRCLLSLLAMFALAGCASTAQAWPRHAVRPVVAACAQGNAYADGCPAANQNSTTQDTSWYTDGTVLQNGHPALISSHPWPWNAAGFDYPVGYYTPTASLLDPTTAANLPSACSFSSTGSNGGPLVSCTGNFTLSGFDFGDQPTHLYRGCVALYVYGASPGASNTVTITNNRFALQDQTSNPTSTTGCYTNTYQIFTFSGTNCAGTFNVTYNSFDGDAPNTYVVQPQAAFENNCTNSNDVVEYNSFKDIPGRIYTNGQGNVTTGSATFEYNFIYAMNAYNALCTLTASQQGYTVTVTAINVAPASPTPSCLYTPPRVGQGFSPYNGSNLAWMDGLHGISTVGEGITANVSVWNGTTGVYTTNGNYLGTWVPLTPTVALSPTTTSSNVAVTSGGTYLYVQNTGSVPAYVALGTSNSVVATTASTKVSNGSTIAIALGSNTWIAGITASGSTALTITSGTFDGSASASYDIEIGGVHGEIGYLGPNPDVEFNTVVFTDYSYDNATFNYCSAGQTVAAIYNCKMLNNVILINRTLSGNGPTSTGTIELSYEHYNNVDVQNNYTDSYGLVNNVVCGSILNGYWGTIAGIISDNGTADGNAGTVFNVTSIGAGQIFPGAASIVTGGTGGPFTLSTSLISGGGITQTTVVSAGNGNGSAGTYNVDVSQYQPSITSASGNRVPITGTYTWANNINMLSGNTVLPGAPGGQFGCN